MCTHGYYLPLRASLSVPRSGTKHAARMQEQGGGGQAYKGADGRKCRHQPLGRLLQSMTVWEASFAVFYLALCACADVAFNAQSSASKAAAKMMVDEAEELRCKSLSNMSQVRTALVVFPSVHTEQMLSAVMLLAKHYTF